MVLNGKNSTEFKEIEFGVEKYEVNNVLLCDGNFHLEIALKFDSPVLQNHLYKSYINKIWGTI